MEDFSTEDNISRAGNIPIEGAERSVFPTAPETNILNELTVNNVRLPPYQSKFGREPSYKGSLWGKDIARGVYPPTRGVYPPTDNTPHSKRDDDIKIATNDISEKTVDEKKNEKSNKKKYEAPKKTFPERSAKSKNFKPSKEKDDKEEIRNEQLYPTLPVGEVKMEKETLNVMTLKENKELKEKSSKSKGTYKRFVKQTASIILSPFF